MSKLFNIKNMFSRHFTLLITLSIILLSPYAHARWATLEDLDTSEDFYNRTIEVHKDGSYVETIEVQIVPTKESGKDSLVSYPLVYNKSSSDIKILEAKTIVNGKEYPVNLKGIEDKPLASSPQGFDQNNQILIAFPQMQINAKAYLKYRLTVKEPAIPGFFSTNFIYGISHITASKISVTSEIPFYMAVSDDESYLDIKQSQNKGSYKMEIALKRPILKMAVEEQYPLMNRKMYPWVSISTHKDWKAFGEMLIDPYETVLQEKLPDLFEKIAAGAKTKATTIEKINTVTSLLAENVSYMGDWRTIKGHYIPRELKVINNSKYGDCKDFSASTVAILRHLGFKADMAMVYRGALPYEKPNDLPASDVFNHAIVRVKEGGKSYWIDPTNFSSFAQGIYNDIANRKALVLDAQGIGLEQTTVLLPKDSQVHLNKRLVLMEDRPEMTKVEGSVSLIGIYALPLIGSDLRASKETIRHSIISGITDESRTETWKVEDLNLTSRIAHDLKVNFNYTERHNQMKTTAGDGYMLSMRELVRTFLIKTKDRVSDLSLDIPRIQQYEEILSHTTLLGNKAPTCSIDSPWLKATRDIKDTKEGIKVVDEFEIKKDRVLLNELNSPEFTQFQSKVYNCFGDTALVYSPRT